MPTLEEVAELERPDFDLDRWVEARLVGSPYAERLVRVYMDLLRLDPGPAVNVALDQSTLYRKTVIGPDGKDLYVYYRKGQRRERDETDGDFCLAASDLSAEPPKGFGGIPQAREGWKPPAPPKEPEKAMKPAPPMMPGAPKLWASAKALADATVLVKPWWLYRDYASADPSKRYKEGWSDPDPAYQPVDTLLFELANTLGPRLTLALGIAWPALLGALCLGWAERRLRSSDLVG